MEPLGAEDPRLVGEYRLLRRLGAGGMGRVYLGRTVGGRTVAVKVVRGELADDAEFRARFRQEVAAARRVGGDWTAPVLDADTESDHPWLATGYVAGPTLGVAVREFGPLPVAAVRALGVGLAEALAHVHGLGLVHRDVKPSNVLLALDGPRLIDFGITRALDATTTAITQSGYVVGSPGFMCPEQAAGEPVGPAGDVFSLGAVLAFAATGVPPFGEAVSAAVMLYRVRYEEPELGAVPGELRAIVQDCLAKTADDRPTPAELRERLAAGASPLGAGGWLPPAVSSAVARTAVELLDLEGEGSPDPVPAGGSAMDATPTEVDRPKAGPGRPKWPLLLALATAVAAGVAVWQLLPSPPRSGGPGQDAVGSAMPQELVGTWEGTITTKLIPLPSTFRVELTQGAVGKDVGRTSNASQLGDNVVCKGVLTLVSATTDHIELQERPAESDPACTGTPEHQTYTLKDSRTLHLDVTGDAMGGNPSGDLTKQG